MGLIDDYFTVLHESREGIDAGAQSEETSTSPSEEQKSLVRQIRGTLAASP